LRLAYPDDHTQPQQHHCRDNHKGHRLINRPADQVIERKVSWASQAQRKRHYQQRQRKLDAALAVPEALRPMYLHHRKKHRAHRSQRPQRRRILVNDPVDDGGGPLVAFGDQIVL